MIQALRAAGLDEDLPDKQATVRILRFRDGAEIGECNVENMYETFLRQAPRDQARCLAQCVRSALTTACELPSRFENARSDVTLKLWSRASLENIRLRSILESDEKNALDLPFQLVGEQLIAVPCCDSPESTQTIDRETLSEWGVTAYEALKAGQANLEETLSQYARLAERVYVVPTGESNDGARLTLLDRIREFEVSSRHVAMVPNRDQLIITGADDELGLRIVADVAEEGLGKPCSLSVILLILDGDAWHDWMPDKAHPLHRRFRELELIAVLEQAGRSKAKPGK